MLVWLKAVNKVNLNLLSATIPQDDEEMAFLVHRLQKSDCPARFLKQSNDENYIDEHGNIILKHSQQDINVNLRAYIKTLLPLLKCRMDVQASDGNSALLQYTASYASKLTHSREIERNIESTAFQVALPFLIENTPGLTEMAMTFGPTSMTYCNRSRVKVTPPVREEFLDNHSIFSKYISRESAAENLSCLQFCRKYSISVSKPKVLDISNLVGVKYKYIFTLSFMFQYVIMNTPFRQLSDIQHPKLVSLPAQLNPMSYMMHNQYSFISNNDAIRTFLKVLSYKDHLINQFISFKDGLIFLYYKALNDSSLKVCELKKLQPCNIEQQVILDHVIEKIHERSNLYWTTYKVDNKNNFNVSDEDSDTDSEDDSDDSDTNVPEVIKVCPNFDTCSQYSQQRHIRPVLISGSPGCGKSFVLKKIVQYCQREGLKVIVAFPTAKQARSFSSEVMCLEHEEETDENDTEQVISDVYCDTVHSIFRITVKSNDDENDDENRINWSLVKADVVIIDEIAKVNVENLQHVFDTMDALPFSPVLIMSGDPKQQRPMGERKTISESVFESPKHLARFDQFQLYQQVRCHCSLLDKHLRLLRDSYPNEGTLAFFNNLALSEYGRVRTRDEEAKEIVRSSFTSRPHTLYLTITREAAFWVNECIMDHLFKDDLLLKENVPIDQNKVIHLYSGLRAMVTRNQCKELNMVNGAVVTVVEYRPSCIIVRDDEDRRAFLVPMVIDNAEVFPLLPYYACTIYKSQGDTLDDVTLWLDIDVKSPGTAYTALSRVRCHCNLRLLEKVKRKQLCPVTTKCK